MQFNRKSAKGTAILGLFVAFLAFAMTQGAIAESAKDNAAEPNADAINELSKAFGSRAEEITESPLTDFFMVELQNGAIVYSTADGKFAFHGDLYGWTDEKVVNLTQIQKNQSLLQMFSSLPDTSTVNFTPEESEVGPSVVYVFTDVDCGYCRLLHEHMAEYHANDIEIRYLAYPRAGIGSRAYNRLVSAWCANDPHDVLEKVKKGVTVAADEYDVDGECSKPVEEHYELGQKIGITGTPTLVLPNGKVVPGFRPATELVTLFDT